MDSGAEVTVWPPELFPEVPTVESDDSRRGVMYFGPGDKVTHQHFPILANVNTVSKLAVFSGKQMSTVVSLVFSDGQRTRGVFHA